MRGSGVRRFTRPPAHLIPPSRRRSPCEDCDGYGWFWWPGAQEWVACATCNDGTLKPKPTGKLAARLKLDCPKPLLRIRSLEYRLITGFERGPYAGHEAVTLAAGTPHLVVSLTDGRVLHYVSWRYPGVSPVGEEAGVEAWVLEQQAPSSSGRCAVDGSELLPDLLDAPAMCQIVRVASHFWALLPVAPRPEPWPRK